MDISDNLKKIYLLKKCTAMITEKIIRCEIKRINVKRKKKKSNCQEILKLKKLI